jgi:hypothetical protein
MTVSPLSLRAPLLLAPLSTRSQLRFLAIAFDSIEGFE